MPLLLFKSEDFKLPVGTKAVNISASKKKAALRSVDRTLTKARKKGGDYAFFYDAPAEEDTAPLGKGALCRDVRQKISAFLVSEDFSGLDEEPVIYLVIEGKAPGDGAFYGYLSSKVERRGTLPDAEALVAKRKVLYSGGAAEKAPFARSARPSSYSSDGLFDESVCEEPPHQYMPCPGSAAFAMDLTEAEETAVPNASSRPSFNIISSAAARTEKTDSLEDMLKKLDESFRDSLLRIIDSKGMTDAECYKKANLDRRHFAKIRNNPDYHPGKNTVLALAVALELTLPEAEKFLAKAGYAFTNSSKSDIIVQYFILSGIYDIYEINDRLFEYDQDLLGAS